MGLVASEAKPGVIDSTVESVHNQGIQRVVHDILDLANHACHARRRLPALEDRKLYTLAVLFADLRDALESNRTLTLRVSDVVGNEEVHDSRHDKGRVASQVAPEVAGEECRLHGRDSPTAHLALEHSVLDLPLLVLLPGAK